MTKEYFVHPTSIVEEGAEVGAGTKIWHFSHIMPGAKIGRDCTIGQNVFVGGKAVIGNRVKIQNNVSVYDRVTLEDDVFCGPSMVFTNVKRARSAFPRKDAFEETLVKHGASIGANATVLPAITVGQCAFVGAGSVVTRDVWPYALVYGVPAELKGWVCECGEKLALALSPDEESATCDSCGRRYSKRGREVIRIDD
jgi:UDP-2-acetamido-3-amino-2,3-dideoxy-glucuronate N-acetyltransferase